MATISSPGIGSNLDVKSIVSQLMAIERQPLALLDTKEASFNAKLSLFGTLKSTLFTFLSTAQNLNISSAFKTLKATVADSSALGATVTGAAEPTSYNIEVQKLAQPARLLSPDPGYASSTTAVGSGTLTLTLGTYTDPTTFVSNPAKNAVTLTIDSSNNTLAGIRDAINASTAGVSAVIINTGSSNFLLLTSKETGAANALKITATEDVGEEGLAELVYDPTTPGASKLIETVAAQDAVIEIDGISVTRSSNTISDAINGVTLMLTKEMTLGTTTKLTLSRDNAGAKTAIDAFVKAYNDLNKLITDATAYNLSTGKGSILTGDASVRSIQSQLRRALSGAIEGAPAGLSTLSQAGITFQRDGTLVVDSSKLDGVLANATLDLSKLFITTGTTTGYASRISTLVGNMVMGANGTVNNRIDSINSSIRRIGVDRNTANAHLEKTELSYLAQFSALDVLLGKMTSTSNYLTQQFNALTTSNNGQ